MFNSIPNHIIKNNILRFLGSEELFIMRGVCDEWKEMVLDIWPSLFVREINNQLEM